MKKNEIRSIPAKVADTLHPSNVTWLSAKETTKRTGVILCVVAASAAFMMLADTLFGAMLRFAIEGGHKVYEETDGCYAVVCYGYDAVGGVCVR